MHQIISTAYTTKELSPLTGSHCQNDYSHQKLEFHLYLKVYKKGSEAYLKFCVVC